MPTDREIDDALRVLRADYWDEVRGIADDVERAVKNGEIASQDDLYEYVSQSVDGQQRVIYTQQARLGLCFTDHVDSYEEETGEKPPTVEAQMFWAMVSDVQSMLPAFDEMKGDISEDSIGSGKPEDFEP